ncbi:little elongation complex subunit 1 isoform X2 [Denticeps clupeoides]|uniref:little elongation complex subunit 1 isoform X2 n=1 Tax=Denticeps clupeoides TaxID=299321 RepID=UPI0010A3520A|nr:little elongation complex subunit 1 isoform X2 [Denticeps clupeoides]
MKRWNACKLEKQRNTLQESESKLSEEMVVITDEKKTLEKSLLETQHKLQELERLSIKELRSTLVQTEPVPENKIDEEKVKRLLEELWQCVRPVSSQKCGTLYLPALKSPALQQNQMNKTASHDPMVLSRPLEDLSSSSILPVVDSPIEQSNEKKTALQQGKINKTLSADPMVLSRPLEDLCSSVILPVMGSALNFSTEKVSQTQCVKERMHRKRKMQFEQSEDNCSPEDIQTECSEAPVHEVSVAGSSVANDPQVEEILDWFRPMLPVLSPVRSPLFYMARMPSTEDPAEEPAVPVTATLKTSLENRTGEMMEGLDEDEIICSMQNDLKRSEDCKVSVVRPKQHLSSKVKTGLLKCSESLKNTGNGTGNSQQCTGTDPVCGVKEEASVGKISHTESMETLDDQVKVVEGKSADNQSDVGTSDEQESFGLRRKIRRTRSGSQGSADKINNDLGFAEPSATSQVSHRQHVNSSREDHNQGLCDASLSNGDVLVQDQRCSPLKGEDSHFSVSQPSALPEQWGICKAFVAVEPDEVVTVAPQLTSTSSVAYAEGSVNNVCAEMGPPLRPLLLPLINTPPRQRRPESSSKAVGEKTDAPAAMSAQEGSPVLSIKSVPSSPLQFGSATPEHAVPVPGRLPVSVVSASSPGNSQENSMQILDTMYPELSAQARTLNILRGNVNLARSTTENRPSVMNPDSHITGFKRINSLSTAFTKTEHQGKRTTVNMLLPRSAKKLCLDGFHGSAPTCQPSQPLADSTQPSSEPKGQSVPFNAKTQVIPERLDTDVIWNKRSVIEQAIAKMTSSCFDVLPVVKSHVFLKRISAVPILRDEEKETVSDFFSKYQPLAGDFMSSILTKLKDERESLGREHLQCLCRVYTAMCRQTVDWEKAHALAYSFLKEEFPCASELILFMVTTWPSVLSHGSAICKAVHTVAKMKADGEILNYLTAYLQWDTNPPCDVHHLISTTLKALCMGENMKFHQNDRYGYDLCSTSWEYVFTLDLLCSHQKWMWTYNSFISKELWPVMNTWVMQTRSQQTPVKDICVAAVLRLIGKLGQLGFGGNFLTSVQKVSKVINMFGKQGHMEGVPWEVQLATVYTIYDLSPSNPKEALDTLAAWRGEITLPVPPAVTSCITQIGSVCRQLKS